MSSSSRKRRQAHANPATAAANRVSYVELVPSAGPGRRRAAAAVLAGFSAFLALLAIAALHHPRPLPPGVDKTVDAYDISLNAPPPPATGALVKPPRNVAYARPEHVPRAKGDNAGETLRSDLAEAAFQARVAHTLVKKGDIAQALRFLHRAAELDPRNMGYRLDLAVLYDRAGDGRNAAQLYHEVLDAYARHDPSLPPSINVADIRKRAAYLAPKASE